MGKLNLFQYPDSRREAISLNPIHLQSCMDLLEKIVNDRERSRFVPYYSLRPYETVRISYTVSVI